MVYVHNLRLLLLVHHRLLHLLWHCRCCLCRRGEWHLYVECLPRCNTSGDLHLEHASARALNLDGCAGARVWWACNGHQLMTRSSLRWRCRGRHCCLLWRRLISLRRRSVPLDCSCRLLRWRHRCRCRGVTGRISRRGSSRRGIRRRGAPRRRVGWWRTPRRGRGVGALDDRRLLLAVPWRRGHRARWGGGRRGQERGASLVVGRRRFFFFVVVVVVFLLVGVLAARRWRVPVGSC